MGKTLILTKLQKTPGRARTDAEQQRLFAVTPQNAENGRNMNPVSKDRLRGSQLEWEMDRVNWLRSSADERVLPGRRVVANVWWAAVGFGRSALILCLFRTGTLCAFGLGLLRDRLLELYRTAVRLNYASGHGEAARSFSWFLHSGLTSVLGRSNRACPWSVNCSGVCWEKGRWVEGYRGLRKWVHDDDCFYYYKKQVCTLDWGSMRSNLF